MPTQEVTPGISIGSQRPISTFATDAQWDSKQPVSPEYKRQALQAWSRDTMTQEFKRQLEQLRQTVLTQAQNSVLNGAKDVNEVAHLLIQAGVYDKVVRMIETPNV